ncbi:hypothetical protein ID855_15470 [Xenorhabdus sp. ZM]|uniref:hypothetical protein n=2 Tax=Xenorhabdus szentirmaii TaxID=290112 RepID=UPI00198F19DB|nr:hypothetical protein [Xenorhabdus sp. ZM]MBD2806071.1 hypothetical protein [Xenorhabdus sp. ZM]
MNIDRNTTISNREVKDASISVSIPDGADVIVGQHCYLVVTVKSPQVKSIKTISIKFPSENIGVKVEKDWKLIDDVSGKAIFMLEVDDKLSSNMSINYTVHAYSDTNEDVQGIVPLAVSYTTKKMKKNDVILLETEMEFLDTALIPSPINDPKSKYNVYSGVIKDENSKPLKNTQVIISSMSLYTSLDSVNITTDPMSGHVP